MNVFMQMRHLVALALALVVLTPFRALAQAVPGSRVLIMPFAVAADPQAPGGAGAALWLGEAAAILLGEDLAALGVGALSRDERAATFDRLQLPMSSALTRATMIRVGELVGASEVVFGEVRLGAALQVQARLIRVTTARQMPEVVEVAPLADLFPVFSRVALKLAAETGRMRSSTAPTAAPLPLEAFESYVKGLVATTPAAQQRFLETAIRLAPSDARVLMALWSVYSAQGFHDKALASANAVASASSLFRRSRMAVALSLIELKRFDGAYQALTSLYSGERNPAISSALGIVQLRRTPPPGTSPAIQLFKRAVDDEPENTDYLFNLGYAHALAENATEALAWLREAVRFDAADGDAHLVMSAVLQAAGRTTEAQREFDLAKLLGVGPANSRTPVARIPSGLERVPGASDGGMLRVNAAIGNPAQRDQRETALFHLGNGRQLVAQSKDREATNELRRAIYLAPYEDEPHLLLGRVYQRGGQLPAAIDEFKVALWCRETTAAHLALAAALAESGDRDGARREAERALVLSPNSAEARDVLKRVTN